jgi:hypothetical protein
MAQSLQFSGALILFKDPLTAPVHPVLSKPVQYIREFSRDMK